MYNPITRDPCPLYGIVLSEYIQLNFDNEALYFL